MKAVKFGQKFICFSFVVEDKIQQKILLGTGSSMILINLNRVNIFGSYCSVTKTAPTQVTLAKFMIHHELGKWLATHFLG